jgi:hypothetical protein
MSIASQLAARSMQDHLSGRNDFRARRICALFLQFVCRQGTRCGTRAGALAIIADLPRESAFERDISKIEWLGTPYLIRLPNDRRGLIYLI